MDASPQAQALVDTALVFDATIPWLDVYWDLEVLRQLHGGGVDAVSLTIQDFPASFEGVCREVNRFRDDHTAGVDWLVWADSAAAIRAAREAGKLALTLNVQDTLPIGHDLDRLQALYQLGVRHMLLAYQNRSFVADGCAEPADAGLSLFGRRLIAEMNRVGMLVDLSHTGRRSTLEAADCSSVPVIYSHSGARAVTEHIRNIDDEQIRSCARSGGVVGIVGIGAFLGDPEARSETVFRHLDHVVQLVGPEHAGLGSDFIADMGPVWRGALSGPSELMPDPSGTQLYEGLAWSPARAAELVQLMLDSGYTETGVRQILGENFLRVFAAAESARA